MSEIRHDWLGDRWVIFAPERNGRPDEFHLDPSSHPQPKSNVECPFCPGNESETPPSRLVIPEPSNSGSPSWSVRVVPNKYPALETIDASNHSIDLCQSSWPSPVGDRSPGDLEAILLHRRSLVGAHEVIVETPDHHCDLSEMPVDQIDRILDAYQQRLVHWNANPTLQYAVIFKNVGPDAGASLAHPHSQLIATSFVPPDVARLCQRMESFHNQSGSCYVCSMNQIELRKRERVVLRSEHFLAYCPFASLLPYSIVIAPIQHSSSFHLIRPSIRSELAAMLRKVLTAQAKLHHNMAYNYILHTSPFGAQWERCFHWRLEIFPRLTKVAGFEWGSNCFINPILPELSAAQLGGVF